MRRFSFLSAAVLLSLTIAVIALGVDGRTSRKAAANQQNRVRRGAYLVSVMGCNDCHTPLKMGARGPEPDMSRFLSGHPAEFKVASSPKLPETWAWAGSLTNTAFAGPWGISYSMNLTPDRNTGLGIWSEEMFLRTIRTGKHWGTSRPIMPPMPWATFNNATDEDLKSVFAYLRTIKPIHNQVPDYEPPAAATAPSGRAK